MPTITHNPYDEPESSSLRLFGNFLLLSLLAHAILVTFLLLWSIFMPHPPQEKPDKAPPTVNLSLIAPPKPPIFVPTTPAANVTPKPQQIESANDRDLTSRSKVARNPDSVMPDVSGKENAPNLNDAPKITSPKPEVSSTPPTPKVEKVEKAEKPEKPAPPQPKPQQQAPPVPQPKPVPPPPKPPPTVDANGLPVLPDIAAPTLAQVNPSLAAQPLTPPVVQPQQMTSVHGALGRAGDNSPAAMATDLGKYKQYVYACVGSYWYPAIDAKFGLISTGMVRIRFTIHSDGSLTDVSVQEGDRLDQLKGVSLNALISSAPFKRFTDSMIKQVGDSYTDEFTFSVY